MSHDSSCPGGTMARADARRNRERILAAAQEVFAEKGASASTEEVASRAGVAIGTVYRHFPTKDDLLRAIMKELDLLGVDIGVAEAVERLRQGVHGLLTRAWLLRRAAQALRRDG